MVHVCHLFVDTWARPIFGLTANLKKMTRDEREERDYSNLTPSARRRLRCVTVCVRVTDCVMCFHDQFWRRLSTEITR